MVVLDVPVMLLEVGSTAGPGITVSCALLVYKKHFRPTASRGGRSYVGGDSVGRSDTAGRVASGGRAVRSKTAFNGVRFLKDGQQASKVSNVEAYQWTKQ